MAKVVEAPFTKNSVIHGGVLQDPSRLVKRAKDFLEEYRGTRELLAVQHTTTLVQNWEPLVGLNYKVNFDAAVFAEEEASGVGVVVRNDKGEAMASLSAKGPPVQDSKEAEALACRRAMEFMVEAGFMDVVLEGENSTVLKAINSFKHNGSWLGHI
ncbi:hypothetical protein SO802_024568 [Lithocarpus litseifolius]|uniref:RNase H type-1 domain-containing protein n=1 Tax=Lithocarpus litseifolius TaxID=425828 RepID=A0AAW2C993_9ROSI